MVDFACQFAKMGTIERTNHQKGNGNMKNLISYSALIIAVCIAGLVAAYIGQTIGNILN